MRRIGKTVIVWTAVLLTAVDPASACRWRHRCCRPTYGYTYTTSCSSCEVSCCTVSDVTNSVPSTSPPAQQPTLAKPQTVEPLPTPAQPAQPKQVTPPATQEVPPPELPPTEAMPEETPKNESPTELPPAAPEEMPDEPAKPAAPGNDVEDLFKDADTTDKKTDAIEPAETPDDAAPAPTEKKSDDVDDLFKDAGDKDSKTSAVNAAELKLSNAIKSIELEELFVDGQAAAPTAEVKPQATEMETLPATTVKVPVSRLQKSRPNIGPRPEAAAVAPTTDGMRVWTDSTGKYRINARLVSVSATSVRLLKDTGKYTTVPKTRLSAGDLAFVRGLSAASVAGKF